jgi:hypothetical protein
MRGAPLATGGVFSCCTSGDTVRNCYQTWLLRASFMAQTTGAALVNSGQTQNSQTAIRAYWLDMFTLDKSMPEKYRNGRKCLMNYAEHARLSALLDPVRVYRGADRKYARGMSWTTDIVVATWFSDRFYGTQFNDSASVFVADVRKSRVLACFAERGEAEVVIDPRSMRFREFEITPEERDENIKQYQRRIHEHNERLIWRNHTAQAPSGCMTLSQRKHEE